MGSASSSTQHGVAVEGDVQTSSSRFSISLFRSPSPRGSIAVPSPSSPKENAGGSPSHHGTLLLPEASPALSRRRTGAISPLEASLINAAVPWVGVGIASQTPSGSLHSPIADVARASMIPSDGKRDWQRGFEDVHGGCVRISDRVKGILEESGHLERLSLEFGLELHVRETTVSKVAMQYYDISIGVSPTPAEVTALCARAPPIPPATSPQLIANGDKVAVFISDMSGFTRLTRQHGIGHFASLIMTMRAIVRPILEQCGALHIAVLADNFNAVFPSTVHAVRAALLASAALDIFNSGRPPHCQARLGGIGISSGGEVRADGPELKGICAFEAFLLGEEVADGGSILLAPAARADLCPRKGPKPQIFAAGEKVRLEKKQHEEDGERVPYFELHYDGAVPVPPPNFSLDHMPAGPFRDFMSLCYRRLGTETPAEAEEAAKCEAETTARFMARRTVLMYNTGSFDEVNRKRGAEAAEALQREKQDLVGRVFAACGGVALEPTLVAFERPEDGLRAALYYFCAISAHNNDRPKEEQLPFDNVALHEGSLLYVPGSDVHWGDPVNTASKLSEDVRAPAAQGPLLPATDDGNNMSFSRWVTMYRGDVESGDESRNGSAGSDRDSKGHSLRPAGHLSHARSLSADSVASTGSSRARNNSQHLTTDAAGVKSRSSPSTHASAPPSAPTGGNTARLNDGDRPARQCSPSTKASKYEPNQRSPSPPPILDEPASSTSASNAVTTSNSTINTTTATTTAAYTSPSSSARPPLAVTIPTIALPDGDPDSSSPTSGNPTAVKSPRQGSGKSPSDPANPTSPVASSVCVIL